jgi:hypothetical protein
LIVKLKNKSKSAKYQNRVKNYSKMGNKAPFFATKML